LARDLFLRGKEPDEYLLERAPRKANALVGAIAGWGDRQLLWVDECSAPSPDSARIVEVVVVMLRRQPLQLRSDPT